MQRTSLDNLQWNWRRHTVKCNAPLLDNLQWTWIRIPYNATHVVDNLHGTLETHTVHATHVVWDTYNGPWIRIRTMQRTLWGQLQWNPVNDIRTNATHVVGYLQWTWRRHAVPMNARCWYNYNEPWYGIPYNANARFWILTMDTWRRIPYNAMHVVDNFT